MGILTIRGDSVRAQDVSWRNAVKTAIRDAGELCQRLALPPEYCQAAARAARRFSVFAPLAYIAKMRPGDPRDPLLRQVLPLAEELDETPGYGADPVADREAALAPGLLQKYSGRALLITTGACAVHCRYCFRRHYPYQDGPHSPARWEPALRRLAADAQVEEVILSGGDPLMVGDRHLADLVDRLAEIRHVRRLRVHTRLPIVIPERVTSGLVALLRHTRLTPLVVVHANHPRELDESVATALGRLIDGGIPLLNQAVLLRAVNDDLQSLLGLCRRLVDLRVLPYYLHQLDRVIGAAHFEVPPARGEQLLEELRRHLPGYAVPRYVRESAGAPHKIVLA